MSEHVCQFPHPTEKNCVGIKREDFRKYHGMSGGWSVSQREAIRDRIKTLAYEWYELGREDWIENGEYADSEIEIDSRQTKDIDAVVAELEAITKGDTK